MNVSVQMFHHYIPCSCQIDALALTAIVCCILVGCFACRQDAGKDPGMTDAQKAIMWKAKVLDVFWSPQTYATHDGVLKDLYLARDAKTAFDAVTGNLMVYFLFNNDEVMKAASVIEIIVFVR